MCLQGFLQDVRLIEGSHGVLAVCPQLDVTCPTCGQFLIFQSTVQDLERKLSELSLRVGRFLFSFLSDTTESFIFFVLLNLKMLIFSYYFL